MISLDGRNSSASGYHPQLHNAIALSHKQLVSRNSSMNVSSVRCVFVFTAQILLLRTFRMSELRTQKEISSVTKYQNQISGLDIWTRRAFKFPKYKIWTETLLDRYMMHAKVLARVGSPEPIEDNTVGGDLPLVLVMRFPISGHDVPSRKYAHSPCRCLRSEACARTWDTLYVHMVGKRLATTPARGANRNSIVSRNGKAFNLRNLGTGRAHGTFLLPCIARCLSH